MAVESDHAEAVKFLQKWSPEGPWILTAITPNRMSIETATFREEGPVLEWLDRYKNKRNIYFHVNPTVRDLTKKAEKSDVKALEWLHVDIDPREGEDLNEERERILGLLTTKIPQGIPEPTCIIFSGGGYQAFWRLADPFDLCVGDDKINAAKIAEAELWNIQLEHVFGGDNCHNVDRIMRLPGTINIPDEQKLKKGRTRVASSLISFTDTTSPLGSFTKAQAKIQAPELSGFAPVEQMVAPTDIERLKDVNDLDKWSVPKRIKVIIVQGSHPDEDPKPSRSEWLFDVVCNLTRALVPPDVIYNVITDPDFGISDSVLNDSNGKPRGSGTVERYALRQIAQAKEHAIDPVLRELNARYAVIQNFGGRCRIIEELPDVMLGGRSTLTAQTPTDFKAAWCNRFVDVGEDKDGKPKQMPAGDWWFKNQMRRQYIRVVFSPAREIEGTYNLWKGFSCEALPGDCTLYLNHVLHNICSGDRKHYEYLLNWMSLAVQKPGEQGHAAVVLRGDEGTGKGSYANHFGHLFGRHYLPISQGSHLTGNFNAHLRDASIVFADEALFAGDKKHEGALKALITEPTLAIEPKGYDVEHHPNFVHLIMASNNDWVVPAGRSSRRYFVLDVSTDRMQDTTYFRAIDDQMRNGGYEALLHTLLNRNLGEFQVRNIPRTQALREQQMRGLDTKQDWWFECLVTGTLAGENWPKLIERDQVQEHYLEHAKKYNERRPDSPVIIGVFLKKVWGITGEMPRPRIKQKSAYQVPSLEKCRAVWASMYHTEIDWSQPDQIEMPLKEVPF